MTILQIVVPIMISVTTFYFMFVYQATPNPLLDACTNDPYGVGNFYSLDYKPIDTFLCMITAMFQNVLDKGALGTNIFSFVMIVAQPVFVFAAIEGCRNQSRFLLFWTVIVGLIGQITTIAVAFPILWLIPYYLTKKSERNLDQAVNANRVRLVGVAAVYGLSISVFLNGPKDWHAFWIMMCQFAPAIFFIPAIGSILFAKANTILEARDGVKMSQTMHYFFGGQAALIWYQMLFAAWSDPTALNFKSWNTVISDGDMRVLLVDGLSMVVTCLYIIIMESGLISAIRAVTESILLGPGCAFTFYFARREEWILRNIELQVSKIKIQ